MTRRLDINACDYIGPIDRQGPTRWERSVSDHGYRSRLGIVHIYLQYKWSALRHSEYLYTINRCNYLQEMTCWPDAERWSDQTSTYLVTIQNIEDIEMIQLQCNDYMHC